MAILLLYIIKNENSNMMPYIMSTKLNFYLLINIPIPLKMGYSWLSGYLFQTNYLLFFGILPLN